MAKNDRKRISRRGFLIGIPLGVAGAFALNAIGGRLLAPKRDSYPKFPEGSIFTPGGRPSPNLAAAHNAGSASATRHSAAYAKPRPVRSAGLSP